MNEIEIYFNRAGNTVVGCYTTYQPLDAAISKKNVFFPHGAFVKGSKSEILRLIENVQLWGNCIKSFAGWKKVCELSGVEFGKDATSRN